MRRLALLAIAAGCVDETVPPWQLDRDRVVAVRAEPPHLLPGEVGRLEALVAHAARPTTIEQPVGASAASAPGDLFTAVHYNLDHWQIDGPDEARLAVAREQLGLAADAPVPLDVTLEFPGPLYATKLVYLGDVHANPPLPPVRVAGSEPAATLALAAASEVTLSIEVDNSSTVRWFTSCGALRDHDASTAMLSLDSACAGQLVAVVRDARGGVVWQVWPVDVN